MLPDSIFHHIGMAVYDIEATAAVYVQGGYHRSSTIYDPVQNVNICWLTREGNPIIELVSPVDDTSPICKTKKKNGVNPYHVCYAVQDMEEASMKLRRMRYVQVSKPASAVAFNGSRVAFFFNKAVGLVELVEKPAGIAD